MSSLTDVDAQRIIDESISEHERRISELKATILALKTRRNTHCAIFKLPTELIANVFLHAKPSDSCDDDQSDCDEDEPDSDRNWLNVSSVCRQWRAIVLDTPQLWCCINLYWEEFRTLAFLKRSKLLPLHVRCTPIYDRGFQVDSPATRVVMATQRIRKLDVCCHGQDDLAKLLKSNPSGSAPALKVLKLEQRGMNDWVPPSNLEVFWHDMPALEVLELRNVHLSSQLPVLPRLTRLFLRDQHASWLIQALQNTPLIEEIVILGLSSDVATEIPTLPSVSLPKLARLNIQTQTLSALKVLDFIECPDSAIINCKLTCHLPPETPDLLILQHILSRIVKGGTIEQIAINIGSREVELWRSDEYGYPFLVLCLPRLSSDNITQYLRFCSILDSSCDEVSLIGFQCWDSGKMLMMWPHFPQCTTLFLFGCSAHTLLSLMRTGKMQRPPLAKLEVIAIRKCSVYDHRQNDDTLIRVLKQREEGGRPLRKLMVRNCDFTEDVINEFRGHVEDVEVSWNRKVRNEWRSGNASLIHVYDYSPRAYDYMVGLSWL